VLYDDGVQRGAARPPFAFQLFIAYTAHGRVRCRFVPLLSFHLLNRWLLSRCVALRLSAVVDLRPIAAFAALAAAIATTVTAIAAASARRVQSLHDGRRDRLEFGAHPLALSAFHRRGRVPVEPRLRLAQLCAQRNAEERIVSIYDSSLLRASTRPSASRYASAYCSAPVSIRIIPLSVRRPLLSTPIHSSTPSRLLPDGRTRRIERRIVLGLAERGLRFFSSSFRQRITRISK